MLRDVNLPLFGGITLFFFTFRFFKNCFPLFLKNRHQIFFISFIDTATIDRSKSFGKQSVTSWFAGMHFSVSGLSTRSKFGASKAPFLHARLGCLDEGGGWWFSGGMEDGLEVIARVLPIELQHLHPLSFHRHHFSLSHTLTLSLSLSLTHTHTHTLRAANWYDFAVACSGQSWHATLAPKMLRSLTEKSTWFYFLAQWLNNPPFLSPPSPLHWVSRGQLQKASLTYWGVLPHFMRTQLCVAWA